MGRLFAPSHSGRGARSRRRAVCDQTMDTQTRLSRLLAWRKPGSSSSTQPNGHQTERRHRLRLLGDYLKVHFETLVASRWTPVKFPWSAETIVHLIRGPPRNQATGRSIQIYSWYMSLWTPLITIRPAVAQARKYPRHRMARVTPR